MSAYPNHPAADLFPMMGEAELRELADDIRQNGLLERIVLHDGMVLDGRNRLAACAMAGVEPQFTNPSTPILSAWTYVLSKNLHRRHLTVSQRAAIAAETVPHLMEEARKRKETLRGPSGEFQPLSSIKDDGGRSVEIAANAADVSDSTVERAWALKKTDPEAFERVKRGELTVNAARHGHKEQPKQGGQVPKDITTKRGKERAEAHKRRMVAVVSESFGMASGLATLDVSLIAAVCSGQELDMWAKKAETNAREFRKFAAALRSFNGESKPGSEREDEGGCADNSSDRAATIECATPEASV